MLPKVVLFLTMAACACAQALFNSNPRQQDHSGGLNFQLDTTGNSDQFIGGGGGEGAGGAPFRGPGPVWADAGVGVPQRPGAGFNSNPRQQDWSGDGGNLQIDTTGNSRQFIGGGGAAGGEDPYGGGAAARGGPRGGGAAGRGAPYGGGVGTGAGFGGVPQVSVDGVDFTGANVQRPGLHINQRPY